MTEQQMECIADAGFFFGKNYKIANDDGNRVEEKAGRQEEKGKRNMKKKLIIIAVLMLLGAGTGAVYAYLTAGQEVLNEVSAADTEIEITEKFTPPQELKPGMTIQKSPSVISHSDQPCYVRVLVRFSDGEAESFCEPLQIQERWTLKEDGYYYWNGLLQPEETTGALFESVKIRNDVGTEELKQFEILVYAEAVAGKGQTAEKAWDTME